MSKKSLIDSVKVGSPCGEDWDKMTGTDKIRFCSHCAKHVNNLSEMTRKQATRLVRASGGDLCIRYVTDPVTRRPLFARQLAQITRRSPGFAAGVMTASIAVSSYGQQSGVPVRPVMEPAAIVLRADAQDIDEPAPQEGRHCLRGTVVDPNGAVIPGANVTLYSVRTGKFVTTSDENGEYSFRKLMPGNYMLETEMPGFRKSSKEVTITARSETSKEDTALGIGFELVVEVKADVDLEVGAVGGVVAYVEYSSDLASAVADDDLEKARELIAKGADPNAREKEYGRITPLFLAVENANIEMIDLLLNNGAMADVRDNRDQTVLMRLDEDATPELVEKLIRLGISIDAADEDGDTVLTLTAGNVKLPVLKALIDAGANVNAANKEGWTALMTAVDSGEVDSVTALLRAGAQVNAKNGEGETAWDLADDDIRKVLEEYGAIPSDLEADEDDDPLINQ